MRKFTHATWPLMAFLACLIVFVSHPIHGTSGTTNQGTITISTFGGKTNPDRIQVHRADAWSEIAYFDLTDETRIPNNATVTRITVSYAQSSGHFALPKRAIFDEKGQGYYVNELNGQTSGHNGKPVRQRWSVRFQTDKIWTGPAAIWPTVTIEYAVKVSDL